MAMDLDALLRPKERRRVMTRTPEQLKRLIRAIEHLQTIPVLTGRGGRCGWEYMDYGYSHQLDEFCETVACAAGHLGLAFGDEWGDPAVWVKIERGIKRLYPKSSQNGNREWPEYSGGSWENWCAKMFGIEGQDLDDTFAGDCVPRGDEVTPKDVARALKKIVKRDHPETYKVLYGRKKRCKVKISESKIESRQPAVEEPSSESIETT